VTGDDLDRAQHTQRSATQWSAAQYASTGQFVKRAVGRVPATDIRARGPVTGRAALVDAARVAALIRGKSIPPAPTPSRLLETIYRALAEVGADTCFTQGRHRCPVRAGLQLFFDGRDLALQLHPPAAMASALEPK
jgi:hypothetical protein